MGDASASIYSRGGSLRDDTPRPRAAACGVGPLLRRPEQGALPLPQQLRRAHDDIAASICSRDGSLTRPQRQRQRRISSSSAPALEGARNCGSSQT